MGDKSIKDIEQLIQKNLGTNKRLIRYEIKNATTVGENYAGVMLRVELVLRAFGKDEQLHAVAKTPNFKVNKFFRDQIPIQYKKEIGFYRDIVPTIEQFYKDEGMDDFPDIFPKLYAGRFNLTGDPEVVDEHAVILMENLVEKGYKNIDRHVGFDLEGAKLLLTDMAIFHAAPLAIKMKKSHLFDIKIKKWADAKLEFKPPPMDNGPKRSPMQATMSELGQHDIPESYLESIRKMGPGPSPPPREPFATIGHDDLWTNNTMQIIKKGRILKNKILDFQMLKYQSPVKDLLFFLSTSLRYDLIDDHFDALIKFYHQQFKRVLENFNCGTSPFEWIHFKKEIELEAKREFGHILMILPAVFGRKGEAVYETEKEHFEFDTNRLSDIAKQRILKMINVFGKKGWI